MRERMTLQDGSKSGSHGLDFGQFRHRTSYIGIQNRTLY